MKMTSASSLSFLIFASVICLIRGQYGFGPYGTPGFGMFGPPMPGFGPRSPYFPPMYGSGSSPPMSYFPSPGFGGRRSGFSPYPPIPPTAFPPPGFPPSPFMSPFVPPFGSPGLPPSFVSGSGSGSGPSPFGGFASSSRPTFQVTRLDGKNIG